MPLAVTLLSALVFILVELAMLVNYLRVRRSQPWSGVPGKTNEGFELTWALGPPVFLAILLALTLQGANLISSAPAASTTSSAVAGQGGR